MKLTKPKIKQLLQAKPSYRKISKQDGTVVFSPSLGGHTFEVDGISDFKTIKEARETAMVAQKILKGML